MSTEGSPERSASPASTPSEGVVKRENGTKDSVEIPEVYHSRANDAILIPNHDLIDREKSYKQMVNRPFKVVQNLPISVKKPDYSLLQHPLSIKDSATLNNSLMVSRHNWLHNVLPVCWTRREQYVYRAGDSKRDRMSKLCEVRMTCGPHTFDARVFILKEEAREKEFLDGVNQRREARQKRQAEKEKLDKVKGTGSPHPVSTSSPSIVRPPGVRGPGRPPKNAAIVAPVAQAAQSLPIDEKPKEEAQEQPKPKQPESDIMANPDNAVMIHNLNSMARDDKHLNGLMQIVASGSANKAQISEFQTYIKKAREIGDVDGYLKTVKFKKLDGAASTPFDAVSDDQAVKRRRRRRLTPEEKERERREKEREKQQRERERAERRAQKEKEKLEKKRMKQQLREERKREKALRKERGESLVTIERDLKDPMDDKLTAFQQRYSEGATLIFEFLENTAARFFIPRDSIKEIIEDEDGDVKSETPKRHVDILFSFVLIHNQTEIDLYKAKQKLKRREREEAKQQKAQKQQKQQEQQKKKVKRRKHSNWGVSKRKTRSSEQQQEKDLQRELKLTYESDNEEDQVGGPTPIFTTMTVRVSGIPLKFAELVKNSGNPEEQAKVNMAKTIAQGKRMGTEHVWYHLDGVKDQLLAETLRFNLNRLDYVNSGGKLKGRAMLKKIVEKSGSEADVKIRRRRKKQE